VQFVGPTIVSVCQAVDVCVCGVDLAHVCSVLLLHLFKSENTTYQSRGCNCHDVVQCERL
jgi:hypothetical protein